MEKNKYLHFNTTFESPVAYKDHYYDITNSDLCVWSLNDFTLINCYPKLRIISDDILIIAQNDIIKIFNLKQGRVVEKIQEKDFIENLETQPSQGVVVTVVAGQDQKTKVVTKWSLKDNTLVKVGSVNVVYDDDISEATFSLFVFSSGKIYLYKIESDIMFEVVVEENQFKKNTVPITTSVVLQLENQKNFAVAQEGKISINDPVKGSVYGSIECQGQIYSVILELPGQDSLITSSNKALKLWFLQSKTQPKIFQKSQKMIIDKLIIHDKQLIGMSTKTKTLAIWNLETQQLIKQQKICRQQIQKSFKIAQKYICLVIKVFDETEESLTFHHRLELVEISSDKIISSKEVKNASYLIQVETLIPVDNQTIRFICSADKGDKLKSYLFTWKPFSKQQKKNMTKIEMSKSPITKLYPYDRLLLATPPKQKTQVYSHFTTGTQYITSISLNTHALKQIVNAKLEGYFDDVEVDRNDKIYGIKSQSISVFAVNNKNNGLEKLNSFELEVTNIFFAGARILCINKQNDRCLYDHNFELIMKQQGQGQGIIDILEADKNQLIISSSQSIQVWDVQKQQVQNHKMQLEVIGACLQAPGKLLITQSDRIQRFSLQNL